MAVLLVFANHLTGWPAGGFIGVDIFFVISGFLITGLLLREFDRTGKISFRGFYARRIKRILPAALSVTVVTVVVASVVFSRARFHTVAIDGLWATFFSANWRFISLGTDYMHVDDALSPLQHYWSLSIEEQFYFIWPVVLVVVLALSTKHKRRAAAVAISTIAVLSFGWAMWETAAEPTWAYFSTFSRAWELAVGALLAIGATRLARIPDSMRPVLAWVGLGALGAGAILMSTATPFPGPFALVPVLGTAVVIAAGSGGRQAYVWPLTNKAANYVGDISYSLYLWHFPVIVFATVFLGETPRRLFVVVLVVTFVLAAASYHFVEDPIRRWTGPRNLIRPVAAVATIAAVAVLSVSLAPAATATAPETGRTVAREGASGTLSGRWALVDEAAAQTEWPQLSPAVEDVNSDDLAPEWAVDKCLIHKGDTEGDWEATASRCQYGDPQSTKSAVVLGDSVAISWVPGIRAGLEDQGYKVEVLTAAQCPISNVPMEDEQGMPLANCAAFQTWAYDRIRSLSPDLVILSDAPNSISRMQSGTAELAAIGEWQAGLDIALGELKTSLATVVVLQPPPIGVSIAACLTKGSAPSNCALRQTAGYQDMTMAEEDAAAAAAVRYVTTESWFCAPTGYCPPFVGDSLVLADGLHLSVQHAAALGPVLADALVAP